MFANLSFSKKKRSQFSDLIERSQLLDLSRRDEIAPKLLFSYGKKCRDKLQLPVSQFPWAWGFIGIMKNVYGTLIGWKVEAQDFLV